MGFERLIALLPLAYIIAWFYILFTWVPSVTNVAWNSITLWTIVGLLAFFIGGGILLIVCFVFFFAFLMVD
ncbi:MAG: hypothetical protein WC365_08320 [Candidatus Babeliales bacterium]|jgi:hypothetical protein